jgi:oligopeptide transport system ATP-binding protein
MKKPLLSVRDLHVDFDTYQDRKWLWSPPKKLHAVNGVSFELERGKTLGVVGESGCGKSTLIRAISGLARPSGGVVTLDGEVIDYSDVKILARHQRKMQMIFQDPIASLNPRMTVSEIVREPLKVMFSALSSSEVGKRADAMLDRVGIARRNLDRYPHEFSGGQCQRIGIARALVCGVELLLCDEPVSALDVSIQAQVVNLLIELQREMGLTLIFVAHDLSVVRHISDDILVMYLGGMMEYAPAKALVAKPLHPYTQALLSAVPVPDPRHQVEPKLLDGELPSPLDLPEGCLFSTRCPIAAEQCKKRPDFRKVEKRMVSCHLV